MKFQTVKWINETPGFIVRLYSSCPKRFNVASSQLVPPSNLRRSSKAGFRHGHVPKWTMLSLASPHNLQLWELALGLWGFVKNAL